MAGYIGSKTSVAQVDGYTRTEADAGFVSVAGDTMTGGLTVGGPFTSLGIDDNAAATAVTVDGSGNVGIGTATPDAKLDVQGPNNGTQAIFAGSTGTSTRGLKISTALSGYQSNDIVVLDAQAAVSGTMVFSTTGAERLRIAASGNVLIGCTSVPSSSVFGAGFEEGSLGRNILKLSCSSTGAAATLYFINPNGVVGSVSTGGSSTSYNTTSDYRLKENITPVQGAADIVKAMRPVTYNFKADSTDWHDGFLAHELQELHPRAVTGSKDAMQDEEYEVTPAVEATFDDEGVELTPAVPAVMGTRSVPEYQGVDYSKLTPILTAALQEALNKIDALEARLTALEVTP